MNHLLLFEAFESGLLSRTVKFLNIKIGKLKGGEFILSLKEILSKYDIPINKITNNNLQYLSKSKGLKVLTPDGWNTNKFGIYCIKFLFSLENGYIGYLGTGNKKIDFNSWYDTYKIGGDKNGINNPFTEKELEYIKNKKIKTGILKPVKDYNLLEHGDKVIGFFGEHGMDIATIYRMGEDIFAIQNIAKGSHPEGDWKKWGYYSWSLGNTTHQGNDHKKLHHYVPNDLPLKVESKVADNAVSNDMDFNFPMHNGSLIDWNIGDQYSINLAKQINDIDFVIVLHLDDILKTDFKRVSLSKSERTKSKEGALKLIPDDVIKKINIKRYFANPRL